MMIMRCPSDELFLNATTPPSKNTIFYPPAHPIHHRLLHFFWDLRPLLEMRAFYRDKLHIVDVDLQASHPNGCASMLIHANPLEAVRSHVNPCVAT